VFEDFVSGHSLSDRVVFKGGDFFVDALPKTDVIVMGHILHDWDLGLKKALLGKAIEALPKGGAVIAYDPIIHDDRRENTFGLLSSLNMLIETKDGFEYTGADCQAWMREAGFSATRVEHLVGPHSMRSGSNRLTARPFDLFEAGPSAGALDWANCDVQTRIWTGP
jgi:hypothetical protein